MMKLTLIPSLAITLFLLVGANFSVAKPWEACSATSNPKPGNNCTCQEGSSVPACNVSS